MFKRVNREKLIVAVENRISLSNIAREMGVSLRTVNYHLQAIRGQDKAKPIYDFARELERLAENAPDPYCRRRVIRTARVLRSRHALSDEHKRRLILEALRTMNRLPMTTEELATDTELDEQDCLRLLTGWDAVVVNGRGEYSENR